mgnify:FL=1
MKIFQCQACDQPVGFESTVCESCERRLGYVCEAHEVSAIEPAGPSANPAFPGAPTFRAYARLYPDSTTLLLDTIDTLESGLPNAITVARELREAGHELRGVRLDSGDLAYLSSRCRAALDAQHYLAAL